MSQQTNMTEGRPLGLLVRFALPIMAGSAFQMLYTVADSAVVGRLIGVEAFAAVGASGLFYWLVFDVILGLSQGFATCFAQHYGAGDREGLKGSFAMAVVLTALIGAVCSAASIWAVRPVLALLRTPGDIAGDAAAYLRVLCGGLTVTFLYNVLGALFRALGDSKTPLRALVLASVLNVALDVVLVLCTPLGVAAVAVATVAAQGAACLYCLWRLRAMPDMALEARHWRFDAKAVRALLYLGGPAGFRNCVISVGGLVIQYAINGYGTLYIAGIAAAKKLYSLLQVGGDGIEGAVATFTAQNYGAGQMDRIRRGVACAAGILLAGAGVLMALLFPLGRRVLGLLVAGKDAAPVLDIAVGQLGAMLVFLPALYLLCMLRAAVQGMGNSIVPMVSGFLELAVRIAAILSLPGILGPEGLYLAEPLGWPCAGLFLLLAYLVVYRSRRRRLEQIEGI